MLDLIKASLLAKGALHPNVPSIITSLAAANPNHTIPDRMKYTIAVSELILFASQFRRNILHWNNSLIPINAISFAISKSGSGKDSSVNATRKCFTSSYNMLDERRKILAKQQAIKAASEAGEAKPNDPKIYAAYYVEPPVLFAAPSTVEGFISHLNTIDTAGIGAGSIFTGEFGSDLLQSPVLQANLQLLAELYDEGSKDVKIIKNKETQSKPIKNLPVSALFIGSQDNILFDEVVKNKFKLEFSTKLARRSFFNFNPEPIAEVSYSSISDLLAAELEFENAAIVARQAFSSALDSITTYQLTQVGEPLPISAEVQECFLLYKRYNTEVSNTMSALYPMSKLVRLHLQWKALKLAGAIAFYNCHDSIELSDYVDAINFTELLDKDMQLFEAELVKEPYELFCSYMHSIAVNGKSDISLHQLRKLSYIPLTGKPEQRMKELVDLVSSYDKDGIYTIVDNTIHLEQIIRTSGNGISFLAVSGDKETRAKHCSYGYEYTEVSFADIRTLLEGDFAYSPFEFRNGVRSKDNIISGCKWICLDIDRSTMSDTDMHFILQSYNHHIVRTSDSTNEFKFRILLELDSYVDINDRAWKHFIKSICDFISVDADLLPRSQIFFSYSDRNILSVTDALPLPVRDHLLVANNAAEQKPLPAKLTTAQKASAVANLMDTLHYAWNAEDGQGSLMLVRAMYHMRDLGMAADDIETTIREINDYWVYPLPEDRLQRTILSQIQRIYS